LISPGRRAFRGDVVEDRERGHLAVASDLAGDVAALNVPVTAFFRKFEEQRDATFVKAVTAWRSNGAAQGRTPISPARPFHRQVARRRTLSRHPDRNLRRVPDLPAQRAGVHLYRRGDVIYRHGDKLYPMTTGDSLFFDADAPHGPKN